MRSSARAVVLAATLNFEPAPIDPFALRVPAIVRSAGPIARPVLTAFESGRGARFCSLTCHPERSKGSPSHVRGDPSPP